MTSLVVRDGRVASICRRDFTAESLEYIDVSHNRIEFVEDRAFAHLRKLQVGVAAKYCRSG